MIVSRDFARLPHRDDTSSSRRLLAAATRLNVAISTVGMGLGAGLALFLGTHVSLAITGDQAGRYLNLLGVFMPGYSATPGGAWCGLLWGTIYGGLSGGVLAVLYARTLGAGIVDHFISRDDPAHDLRPPVLLMSGHAVGAALGGVAALQLLLTTGWLILRGTASESPHAALLSNYLPGYSTTVSRALLGAAELFLLVYAFSLLTCTVYNLVARWRNSGGG